MNASDLRALKIPLITLAVVIAISASALYYTHYTLKNANLELARQHALQREARAQLQKAGDDREIIGRYLNDYRYLQQLGFVGEEQRINWLEGLRLTNHETQMFGVDYQISTQQPYPYASELDPGQLAIYQSVMKVTFRLLHEGDLMRFLGALAQQGVGVFSVNQCVMERIDTGDSLRNQPNLRANCELAWITLRPQATTGDGKS